MKKVTVLIAAVSSAIAGTAVAVKAIRKHRDDSVNADNKAKTKVYNFDKFMDDYNKSIESMVDSMSDEPKEESTDHHEDGDQKE